MLSKSVNRKSRLKKSSRNKVINRSAQLEIWWRKLDRTPKSLLKIINHCNDEDKISEAVIELGKQKYKGAIDLFINLLKNKSSSVRTSAAIALNENPVQKAFLPLIRAIKKHKEHCSAFVFALEKLNCTEATEFLVDLFIAKPNAPIVRINIIECFEVGAVTTISSKIGRKIKTKISNAIRESKNKEDKYELRKFYKKVIEPKIQNL